MKKLLFCPLWNLHKLEKRLHEFELAGWRLQSIADGENTIEYAYNGDGNRISKTVNGVKTEFIYNGDILVGQITGDDTLVFMYDNNSDIFGFVLNGTEYYYIKNAKNDVTAIADKDGNVLAGYTYDSWGKVTEITGDTALAEQNPIRYRSYYYDFETEWYFLNTRYYSPDMCRFINADGYVQTGQNVLDKNMFAYCLNSPVCSKDSNGNFAITITSSTAITIAVVFVVFVVFCVVAYKSYPALKRATGAIYNSVSKASASVKTKVAAKRKIRDEDPRVHHIVAQNAKIAAPAREILESVGINPRKDPLNLITIPQGLHKGMHTTKYYDNTVSYNPQYFT